MENSLPKGWKEIELKYLGEYINGRAFKPIEWKTFGLPIIRIQNLNKSDASYNFSDKEHEEKYRVRKGDLLMAWSASLGVYIWQGEDAWLNQHIFKVLPNAELVTKEFLFYALKEAIDDFYQKTHGSGMVHITKPVFEAHKVPLPPLAEQHRIVAKLDALLARVANCKSRLEKIPGLLKNFRQSALAAAVSGELTKEWREKNKIKGTATELLKQIQQKRIERYQQELKKWKQGKAKKPRTASDLQFTPLIISSDEYPENWSITRIADVADCLDYIRQPINKDERAKRIGKIPYYGANGQVGWIDDYLFDEDLVVVVEDETFLGREIPFSYIIRGKSWVNNHAHVLKPCGGISVDYLNICWSFYNFTPLTSGTTGRRKLTQAALLTAEFAIAPLEEQKEIVRKVEELFHFADSIEARYQKAKAWFDKLPQAILAKAFRGELVELDENDEPASVLLERVKKEKQNTNKLKQPAKRKKVYEENEGVSLAAEE